MCHAKDGGYGEEHCDDTQSHLRHYQRNHQGGCQPLSLATYRSMGEDRPHGNQNQEQNTEPAVQHVESHRVVTQVPPERIDAGDSFWPIGAAEVRECREQVTGMSSRDESAVHHLDADEDQQGQSTSIHPAVLAPFLFVQTIWWPHHLLEDQPEHVVGHDQGQTEVRCQAQMTY